MRNRILFLIFIFCNCGNLYAQYEQKIRGRNHSYARNTEIQGSPFLYDEWRSGKIILKDGTQFENIMLMFDAEQNRFLYMHKDSLYEFIDDLSEIVIYDRTYPNDSTNNMVFRYILNEGNKLKSGKFVHVLCQGKVTLVKEYVKNIEGENRDQGFRITTKQYVLHTSLKAIVNNQYIAAKLSPNFLEQIILDKKSEVENYVKAKKLNVKSEKGFVAAVIYYNLISK